MKHRLLIAFLVSALIAASCKKDNTTDCFSNATTLREITNKQATIESVNEEFYIVEEGAIDTKLVPCNLPAEFREDNLNIIISGEIKLSLQAGPGPCCTENLLITKITR